MRLEEPEYDSQVVDPEPEVFKFPITDHVDEDVRRELADGVLEMFSFDPTPEVTNWDRNLRYPRKAHDYNYHTNLYRQMIGDRDEISLSWIQAMDLAYVAGEAGYPEVKDVLESFASDEFDESLL